METSAKLCKEFGRGRLHRSSRDVNRAIEDEYPLCTAGRYMRKGKDRVQVESINKSINLGNVRVDSRDIVVADVNGVLIVPRARAREVADAVRNIAQREECIRTLITTGKTLGEARKQLAYHTLQR